MERGREFLYERKRLVRERVVIVCSMSCYTCHALCWLDDDVLSSINMDELYQSYNGS